jgi:hypothetical protein
MITILIATYLIIGGFTFALIWAILVASKRRDNRVKNVNREHLEPKLFRESNTKPSGFHP